MALQQLATDHGGRGESLVRLERHLYRLEHELQLARACFETLIESGAGERRSGSADQAGFARLTPREKRVALLIAEGNSNRRIAELLNVSVHTVKSQVRGVFNKLDLHSRWQLAGWPDSETTRRPLQRGSAGV